METGKVYKYKGYEIFKRKDMYGKSVWCVGNTQADGRMFVHASGYSNLLSAKRAADAHFGRL